MTEHETDQLENKPRERTRKVVWGVTAVAGGALAGAILAGGMPAFATSSLSPSSSASGATGERGEGDHGDHAAEQALTGSTAAKVRAAALAKLPGATVERLEKDSDGAVYEAHLVKSDGTRVTVKLDASFTVTGVETGGPGEQDGRGHGGRAGEVALTGEKAAKAKAAALAKLPGATVVRVETDADGATYEAHVTKADGTEATVKMDASFTVTSVEAGR
jgi:uncharacterized membrane protein YkoI